LTLPPAPPADAERVDDEPAADDPAADAPGELAAEGEELSAEGFELDEHPTSPIAVIPTASSRSPDLRILGVTDDVICPCLPIKSMRRVIPIGFQDNTVRISGG
jgi:hypothetical protein